MNLHDLKQQKLILLECISGSKAYGLNTPQSDTDIKGVFALSKQQYYGLTYTEQLNNESNDIVFYELKRYVDLLSKNNPNIIELLATPHDCILHKDPVMDLLQPEMFLSKLCEQTFAGYAQSQIKKAKGLNKKIVNPVEKVRKSVEDFCYVVYGQGSVSLNKWLEIKNYKKEDCGLVNIPHMRDTYSVFHNFQLTESSLKGISSGADANDICLSSIPEGIEPVAVMSFNKDGYSKYCKDYKAYWEWVENRNEQRYENTIEHGKNYDAKNMMHTFRLLNMAEEIAKEKRVNVRRKDRDYLLKIRAGEFEYDDLVIMAEEKTDLIQNLFKKSDLPDFPDTKMCDELLFRIRNLIYIK